MSQRSGDEGHTNPAMFLSSSRRRMAQLVEDIRETRDQGKKAMSDPSQVSLFKGMHLSLSSSYEQFESLYCELCDMVDDNNQSLVLQSDHDLRSRVRRYFHESNGMWNSFNEAASRQSTSQASTSSWSASRPKTKLPTLELPRFSGERTKWPRFKDTFTSLVGDDPDLSDIDRFHYLIRSLQGNAAAVISHVPVTGAHFKVAWDALVQAYDNQRLLAAAYLDQLLDLKPLHQKPTAETLGQTVAALSEISAAFNLLNIPDKADFIFFHLSRRCLDSKTREDFELNNRLMYPTFDSLVQYLRSRCTASELATGLSQLIVAKDISHGRQSPSRPIRKWTGQRVALLGNTLQGNPFTPKASPYSANFGTPSARTFASPSPKPKCYVCGEPHHLSNCLKFATANVNDRLKMLRTWRGCRNCLQVGHGTPRCPSTYRCRFCRGRHHSLLHPTASTYEEGASTDNISAPSTSQKSVGHPNVSTSTSLNAIQPSQLEIMLGTAVCSIEDIRGQKHDIRLVIDSGSHFSFLSRTFAERLGLKIETHTAGIWGIGETPLPGFKGRAACKLSPTNSNHPRLTTNAIVLDVITSPLPGFSSPSDFWKPYKAYPLADPEFWVTRPIDLLIGCDLFTEIVTGDVIRLSPSNKPCLLGTIFGYSILGRIKDISAASSLSSLCTTPAGPSDSLDSELRRFWELEEPPTIHPRDPEEIQCEEQFRNTTYRLPDGRYVVRLPFRKPEPQLPGSRSIAIRRLSHLEAKLARNPVIRTKYHEFLSEYLSLGHMELAPKPGKCFIPHHCVVKGEGEDLKLRVVFDAAARTTSGSLNDALSIGPKLQSNSTIILLNFRLHPIVFTADAVKMYRQILVHPDDRVYQHILWRFNPSAAVSDYQLNTVSYGQSCAPYLALRVLQQLVLDEGHAFPLASAALRDDTYIDDIATGAATVDEALQLLNELVMLMGKGGFTLSKWASNHPGILATCHHVDPTTTLPTGKGVCLGSGPENNSVNILGLQWNPVEDCFYYRIVVPKDTYTKRAVLSAVAKIYDPLGYLGPTVILAKKLIQASWRRRLAWDEEFPVDLRDNWTSFINNLPVLHNIKLPRWIVPTQGPYSILIFADASEEAYCAAAYLRSVSSDGPQLHLILAKTKLAPIKFTTIPRLELCAALLAAKLWQSLEPFVRRLPDSPDVHFFSDSTVVLTWLRTPYHLLKTFVANRVVQIRDLTSAGEWRHVYSADNPSDLGSRGVSAHDLLHSTLWFSGPPWALTDRSSWPVSIVNYQPSTPELKSAACPASLVAVTTDTPTILDWMNRFSSYTHLIRSLAYSLRFIDRLRGSPPEPSLLISLCEIRRATSVAVKLVQRSFFFKDHPSPPSSIPKHLASLNAFLSDGGLLMVGGRLKHSGLPWEAKHPIILPPKAHLSMLILDHYHRALLHPGPTLLLAAIRSKFWILGARNAVRALTKKCVSCRRFDARPAQPLMADLPPSRFSEGRVFVHVGIDFAGPFMIRESLRRKAPSTKAYLCLMVCLSTKALHLEVVSSMSTSAFLAALDRFIGRRGLPSKILSDNGSNFVGAANQLRDFYRWYRSDTTQTALKNYALQKEIEWEFIPPHAPSFGGIWEAGVKSVKRLMRTVYGDNAMTFEELTTLLTKIESILNSRPLCPLSADPDDIDYLSPGHFLIGSPLLTIPEPSLLDLKENSLSRWQLVAQKAQHFWARWRREYLSTLQARSKWKLHSPNLRIGELVLLIDDTAPRMHWPTGRIHNVFPGQDGVVRVVEVKTTRSLLKRPVNKIVPLFAPHTTASSDQ